MKRILVVFLAVISIIAMMATDAEARRLGGGRSFGKQSPNVSRQQAPAQQPNSVNQTKPAPAAAGVPRPSPWKGMLGGALLGLGLGALLSGMGVGAGMANIISMLLMAGIAVAVIMLLLRLFRQRAGSAQSTNYAYSGSPQPFSGTPQTDSRVIEFNRSGPSDSSATWTIPADFDVPQFERAAQTYFIRLQAAWDKADIADIAEFTTPEMYAEIKLELQERGPSPSLTDVITVNAKLLGVENRGAEHMASVRFVGTIREEVNAPTESFEEIWNLTKPASGQTGWVLAGIQQVG